MINKAKENLKDDYVYGSQKKYFPFNPVYTPSSSASQCKNQALHRAESPHSNSRVSEAKIQQANIHSIERLQYTKKQDKLQACNINISPKKYSQYKNQITYGQPLLYNQACKSNEDNSYLQKNNQVCTNSNYYKSNQYYQGEEKNISFTKSKNITPLQEGTTPQKLYQSSIDSTIPRSPHPLKTLTPAQKDVMNKYLTGNRNLQLGFEKFQKRQQFFQMSSVQEKKQELRKFHQSQNNYNQDLSSNLGFDTKAPYINRQLGIQNPFSFHSNYDKDNLSLNINNNYDIQYQMNIGTRKPNQIDIEQERVQQKLDQMLKNTRQMMMYHNQ